MSGFSRILFVIVTVFCCTLAFSQDPAYFRIGQKELANAHVYTLHYSSKNQLFVGTNQGLYVHRNGRFQLLPNAPGQNGNAVFGIREREDGTLYCFNLSGQVFRIDPTGLKIIATIPQKHLGNMVFMEVDDQDRLVLFSSSVLVLEGDQFTVLQESTFGSPWAVSRDPETGVIFFTFPSEITYLSIFALRQGKLHQMESPWNAPNFSLATSEYDEDVLISLLFLKADTIGLFSSGKVLTSHHSTLSNSVERIQRQAALQFSKDEVWIRDQQSGFRNMSIENNGIKMSKTFLEDYFISSIFVHKNGTIYLGTFGGGILVIPDIHLTTFAIPEKKPFVTQIANDGENGIFLGTHGKNVYHFEHGKFDLVVRNKNVVPSYLFYADGFNFEHSRQYPSLIFQGKNEFRRNPTIGPVKDIWKVDDETVLLCSPDILKKGPGLEQFNWSPHWDAEGFSILKVQRGRYRAITYDAKSEIIYYSDPKGLIAHGSDNKPAPVRFKGKPVYSNALFYYNEQVWCGTQNHGILILEGGEIVDQVEHSPGGLGHNYIRQIEIKHNRLFVSHRTGFQIYDFNLKKWYTLGSAEGILNGSVQEFAVGKTKLWLLSQNVPTSIELDQLPYKEPELRIYIDSISMGGSRIDETQFGDFSYDENSFSVYFDIRGLEFLSEARLFYRMDEKEESWQEVSIVDGIIELRSLPYEAAHFELKCMYRGQEVDRYSYRFQISPPFWQRWWFYLLIAGFIGLLSFVIFFYRLRQIRKKNKERLEKQRIKTDLLESELKALRSQMNPHFIFNSLNSIQDLVLKEDTEGSYDYIVLFAELVRSTLNYSNKDFIPIEDEIKFLDVYLSLEKLRFKEEFNYEIISTGTWDIRVPSLIIQPFIENALLHGLIHKKGEKRITVRFEMDDQLIVTVTDNGVGRVRAKEILSRQGSKHESFALKAIEQRLELLNSRSMGDYSGYTIEDLYENGEASGTRVTIHMPFQSY